MFTVSNICKNTNYIILQCRQKSKTHWAKLRKKDGPKYKAMNHFDDFYGSVFGEKWGPMKEALLRRSKYVAVVNNYGDTEETMENLQNRGAHCLKTLVSVQQQFHDTYSPTKEEKPRSELRNRLADFVTKVETDDVAKVYPQSSVMPDRLDTEDATNDNRHERKTENKVSTSKFETLEESLAQARMDESRIVDPSVGLTSELLYQFVPATKLKGMNEWIPESAHYSYYTQGKDFPLVIEPETNFHFPEHLKVYTYEKDSEYTEFPEPKRGQTGVLNYYPMDCGSVLAVLALCLNPGDRVLDLCSAPGGKSLVALQTLLPDIVVCNDISIARSNRTQRIFRDYLHDFETSNKWRERVILKRYDGRYFTDDEGFDKVLVDVPCTIDRHSVNEDENNIFRPDRIKERLKIPEMQSQLLVNGLRLTKVGGALVYSTCSLSPIQNDGVVHMALKYAFEAHGIVAVVRDLSSCFTGYSSTLEMGNGDAQPKYGQLVTPSVGANFGPSYFARLVRIK